MKDIPMADHISVTDPELVKEFPMLLNVPTPTPEREAMFQAQFEEHKRIFANCPNPYVYSKKDSDGPQPQSQSTDSP